jgi:hypothetical protein
MPKGKFNTHQNAHIESFMPDFVKELYRGLEGVPLTHWKQAKASHILESDLFSNLDMSEISRKGWFDVCSPIFNSNGHLQLIPDTDDCEEIHKLSQPGLPQITRP